jgi:hypothetical protein
MANKKYTFEFDFNTKDVKLVTDGVSSLRQEIRALEKELTNPNLGAEEFEILKNKLNDSKDEMAKVNAKSRELFGTLQLIPGPIGEIASKIDGTISLFKTFSTFTFKDVKSQLSALVSDIGGIAKNIGNATGLTKLYTNSVKLLAGAFTSVGIAEGAATVAARALSAAIAATGVGLLVVGIGLLVSKIGEWVSSTNSAESAQKQLAASIELVSKNLEDQRGAIADQTELDVLRAKIAGESEDKILQRRKKGLQDQIEIDKQAVSDKGEFAKKTLQIELAKYKNEDDREKDRKSITDQRNAASKRIYENGIAIQKLELEGQIAANEKSKANGEKALARATKLSQDILNQKKDAIQQYNDALEQGIQNEVDAEETSAAKLEPLIKKRVQAENDELDKAKKRLDQQLKDKIITQEQFNVISDGIEAKRAGIVIKYKKLVDKALEEDKKKKEDKKKDAEEEIKDAEDFQRRIAEIKATAIGNAVEKEKTERQNKYNNELADLEKDKNFIKMSEEQKAAVRKDLKTALENDLKAIDTKAKEDQKQKDQKAFDDRLKILELQSQGLLAGTQAYFDNRKLILDETQAKELAGLVQGSEEYIAVKKKYDKLYEQLDQEKLAATGKVISATLDAFAGLGNAIAGSYDEEAKTSEEAFNKRKRLQKATAIMSAASGIVQILTQPSTLPSPFDWIVKGINAAALGISTAINIKKIDQTKFEAPSGGGGNNTQSGPPQPINVTSRASGGIITGVGTATSDSIPARLSNGEYVVNARATSQFLPLLNSINDAGLQPRFAMGGLYKDVNSGYNVAENITNAITSSFNDRPIKTYVVGKDMSNQQQMDRTIKSRSLI